MDIMQVVYATNPYEGFQYQNYPLSLVPEWQGGYQTITQMVEESRPSLIIEVGSWKGDSAINMANTLKRLGLTSSKVVCVDTWLGSLEFWTDRPGFEHYKGLMLKNGYPSVYYQFLANICHMGLQDYIVPFPQTSEIAALFFNARNIKADLIYIDGSHEDEFAYRDAVAYYKLLQSPNSILFGNDYVLVHTVRQAIDRFIRDVGKKVEVRENFWILRNR